MIVHSLECVLYEMERKEFIGLLNSHP